MNQNTQNQPTNNQHNGWEDAGHKVEIVGAAYHAVKGLEAVQEGIEEQDGTKVGEGIATVGLAGVATAMTGGAPVIGGAIATVAGTAAGATVTAALLPLSVGLAVGGVAIWGISKLLDK